MRCKSNPRQPRQLENTKNWFERAKNDIQVNLNGTENNNKKTTHNSKEFVCTSMSML